MVRFYSLVAALLCALAPLAAIQIQDLTADSPVTGQKFPMVYVPIDRNGGSTLTDMGSDVDGCRHSSGLSEYEYAVATCPFSYFTALTVEWNETSGQFRDRLPDPVKEWVKKQFNTEQKLDLNRLYDSYARDTRARGQEPVERKVYVIPQSAIPIERRFRYALLSYDKRGARPAVLAKVALTAAWALRARANIPLADPSLDGGYEEVNAVTGRFVKEGEAFTLAKWLPVYRDLFNGGGLTREGYTVAGMTYMGLALRDGDLEVCRKILGDLKERFQDDEGAARSRDLQRVSVRMLDECTRFLQISAGNFVRALEDEDAPRSEIPVQLLIVGECLRRSGNTREAMDWFLALSRLAETQPALRADMRAQGKAPSIDAPFLVQLGWNADELYARLTAAGTVHSGEVGGNNKRLLNAILHDGMGNGDYVNPDWRPRSNGTAEDAELILQLVGGATLVYASRFDNYPEQLNELWTTQQLKDRNRVNRFHCPVSGKPLLYRQPKGTLENTSPRMVLVACPDPIPTNQGPRYVAYLAGDKVVWGDVAFVPGEIATK